MLFFLSSLTGLFLFLLYSIFYTQTIAKWKKRVIWEICTLTGQTVVVWCGSRSGELSLEIMGLGIFICLKNEVPQVVK